MTNKQRTQLRTQELAQFKWNNGLGGYRFFVEPWGNYKSQIYIIKTNSFISDKMYCKMNEIKHTHTLQKYINNAFVVVESYHNNMHFENFNDVKKQFKRQALIAQLSGI